MRQEEEFPLPVGTVTLLMSDVEGSTRRWQEDQAEMGKAMAELRRLIEEVISRHHGVRPLDQGEGDSFLAVFARPSKAVACAIDIQKSSPLPLRIGIHIGEAQRTAEGNYVGPAVSRAARLRDLGHGGQVLLSQGAAEVIKDRLPEESLLEDLGSYQLRDLPRPERVFQLRHRALVADFPPLRTLHTSGWNLPTQRTRFFGRDEVLGHTANALQKERLVTIAGPGGAGKTRVALQLASTSAKDFLDGVHWVELAGVKESSLIPPTVALSVRKQKDGSSADSGSPDAGIRELVGQDRALLVLDNCEHLIEGVKQTVDEALQSCPHLKILTTSRVVLGLTGEAVVQLGRLDYPPEKVSNLEEIASFPAVKLFVDRAELAWPNFDLTESSASIVADITRLVDGLPLAIELAAAHVRSLSVEQIRNRLAADRLKTLSARSKDSRHSSLETTFEWGYDLLTPKEQTLLARLSVFSEGFTLEAVERVCDSDDLPAVEVYDVLTALIDQSFVVRLDGPGPARYGLLETIRQYASSKLAVAPILGQVGQAAPTGSRYLFAKLGHVWRVGNESHTLLVKDSKGMAYLQRLLDSPGRDIHVLDLVQEGKNAGRVRSEDLARMGIRSGTEHPEAVLDDQAIRAYKARYDDLQEEIDEALRFDDQAKASLLKEELQLLGEEMSRSLGLGGKSRMTTGAAEKARTTVTKAIRSAIRRIKDVEPEVGEHLDRKIATGTFCRYDPDPQVTWALQGS